MNKDTAIEVNNVSKKFCKSLKSVIRYGLTDISRGILGFTKADELRNNEFWALKNISFEIKKGESLGIIGANGSGKTTILKLLNGIFMPDIGKIFVKGKVGALIAVGAGFNPLLTGRENIYINAAILGMKRKEIKKKFSEIVDFAEIGDFLDTPVRNYSSGMYVRLGFSIAIHSEQDILLVDEILSVGDLAFRKKAVEKMEDFVKSEKTIIFVSHNIKTIKSFTKKAIYLKDGCIKAMGRTPMVIEKYMTS